MKNFFKVLTLLAALPFCTSAQITIISTDIDPIGYVAVQKRDTTFGPNIQPGDPGMQTWDFSMVGWDDADTLTFLHPNQTPYFSEFPDANVAALADTVFVPFFKLDTSAFKLLGSHAKLSYNGNLVSAPYRFYPAQTIIQFPANLGDTFSESNRFIITATGAEIGQPYDSVRLVTNSSRNVTIDGFGTMTIPLGTFEVLRFKEVDTAIDSIYVNNGAWFGLPSGTSYTTTRYKWWTNENGLASPIFQYEIRQSGDLSIVYIDDFVSSSHSPKNLLQVKLSPNPATDQLRVELPEGFTGQMEVYDLNGKLMTAHQATAAVETLDLRQCAPGHHVLVLKAATGKLHGFQRFEVIR